MNITHIIIGLNVGGAELMLARLVAAHVRSGAGVQHHVVSLTSLGEIGARLQREGIAVEALGMRSALGAPAVVLRLVRLFRAQRPDIVQTWMYHADLLGGVAARLAGVRRVVWGVRTTDITRGGSRVTRGVRWLCARLSASVPVRIVCAAQASLRIHALLGYSAERMMVIPNGLDLDRMVATPEAVARLRADHGIAPDDLVVGMVGRFNPIKGQREFVQAAARIAVQFPDCRFVMVGRDCDRDNAKLAEWLDATGVGGRFVLLDNRSDVPVCLAAMDVFVLPSRTEGFPNVLSEAMAMARPCVSTDVGDAARVLGNCGAIVPPEDVGAISDAVLGLLESGHEKREQLGVRARERVIREYSMERCARAYLDLYDSIMTTNGGVGS